MNVINKFKLFTNMKLNQIAAGEMPIVPVRNGLTVKEGGLEALKGKGLGLVTFGMNVGDTFEFPDTPEDVKTVERQVRPNSTAVEMLILGLKNGKPAYLSVANLRRRNHKAQPVHPVAEALNGAQDDMVRVEMCLGRTITANEEVTFDEAIFEDGTRTDGTRPRTVAKLIFMK